MTFLEPFVQFKGHIFTIQIHLFPLSFVSQLTWCHLLFSFCTNIYPLQICFISFIIWPPIACYSFSTKVSCNSSNALAVLHYTCQKHAIHSFASSPHSVLSSDSDTLFTSFSSAAGHVTDGTWRGVEARAQSKLTTNRHSIDWLHTSLTPLISHYLKGWRKRVWWLHFLHRGSYWSEAKNRTV